MEAHWSGLWRGLFNTCVIVGTFVVVGVAIAMLCGCDAPSGWDACRTFCASQRMEMSRYGQNEDYPAHPESVRCDCIDQPEAAR